MAQRLSRCGNPEARSREQLTHKSAEWKGHAKHRITAPDAGRCRRGSRRGRRCRDPPEGGGVPPEERERFHSLGGRRSRLICARRRLASSRRSTAPREGRVGRRRGAGGAIASANNRANLASAARRLSSCERCSDADTVRTPLTNRVVRRCRARSLSRSGSAVLASRSKLSSTRESAVLTDCPPGPLARLNRHLSSARGTTTSSLIRTPSCTPPA